MNMKAQKMDLYGDPIPEKRSNPKMMKYCKRHGLVKHTSYRSKSQQTLVYQCSVCHGERSRKKYKKEKEQGGIIDEKVKQSMFANHISKNLPCPDCGKRGDQISMYEAGNRKHVWNIDHIDPDGPSTLSNLRVVCQWCNKKKYNKKTYVRTTSGALDV